MGIRTARAGKKSGLAAVPGGATYPLSGADFAVLDSAALDPRIRLAGGAGLGR